MHYSALAVFLALIVVTTAHNRPHIVFIFADDYGYNDVGYHQQLNVTTNFVIRTPNLDALAASGVKLEQYYTQPLCSPSRSAFLTGRYPSHTGVGPFVINLQKGYGIPPKEVIIPQRLKNVGYRTHAVGKWHLGFCDPLYLPTHRGFDSWFGYVGGHQDYWTHRSSDYSDLSGYDLRSGNVHERDAPLVLPVSTYEGTYSLYMHVNAAQQVINEHAQYYRNKPLFLYLALQSVHDPVQVPDKYVVDYEGITDETRRTYAGMVSAMDEGIGNVTNALIESGLWDNTVLIVASDNGGHAEAGQNNYPLRGEKQTNFEGGVRAVAFVTGPGAKLSPEVVGTSSTALMHVTDWFPTIMELAGATSRNANPLDGVSQWNAIANGGASARDVVVLNMSPRGKPLHGAIRQGPWKLIFMSVILGSIAMPRTGQYLPGGWTDGVQIDLPPPVRGAWLFNVIDDPYETTNLVESNPDKYQELMKLFFELQAEAVGDLDGLYPVDPLSLPSNNEYDAWIAWSQLPNTTCTAWREYEASQHRGCASRSRTRH